jgi:hypothetical protein
VIYLDGSALCRFLPGVRHYEAFGAWARDHIDELVTTQLGFTELRQAAELYPRSAVERVGGIVDLVRAGVAVIRFSDDNVAISSHATIVLKPFAALHVGAAVAHPNVDAIVTYDPALANVARIYELAVVSPGLPDDWYFEYQGPPEHWKPVALDAPYDPGAEFSVPDVAPQPDAYEIALGAARLAAAAEANREASDGAEPGSPDADADSDAGADPDADPGADPGADPDADPGADPDADPDADPGADPDADPGADPDADPGADASSGSGEVSDLERALREAEAAVVAEVMAGADALDEMEEEAARAATADASRARGGRGAEQGTVAAPASPPLTGTYRPRIETWHEGDAELDRPEFEPEGDVEGADFEGAHTETTVAETTVAETGDAEDGLPWLGRPEGAAASPEPTSPAQDAPILAPPAPIGPVGIPNLPREERGVPPVAPPASDSIGSAVRRPMFETNPHPDSRASRPPDPVPPVPPEESSPLTVPIKWNVELDEPEAYLPRRFDSESARVLPSAPVSFAGGQRGLTLESAGSVAVPALEPTGPQAGAANWSDAQAQMAPPGSGAPMSARERKAADKAAKKDNERREKNDKKAKGTASAPSTASSEVWKLEDVLNPGHKKQGS